MVSETGPQMSIAMMSAPSLASLIACARPWPRAAPVMNATRRWRLPLDAVTAAPFVSLRTRLTAELERVLVHPSGGVADQRTRHAVAAAAAAAELRADDGDYLDASPAQQGVRVGVAVVCEHHSRFYGNEVVAAVPLLALRVVGGSARLDHPQLAEPERSGHHLDERLVRLDHLDADVVVAWVQREGLQGVDDIGINGHHVAIGEGEDGV